MSVLLIKHEKPTEQIFKSSLQNIPDQKFVLSATKDV